MYAARIGQKVRLNNTMTSTQATCRLLASCVGRWEADRKTHVPRGGAMSKKRKLQVAGAKRHAEPVRIRRSCPCFPCLEDRVGRVPRGTGARIRVFFFRQFARPSFSKPANRKVHLQIRPINRNSIAKEEEPIQDDVQEAGRCHP